MKRVVRLVPFSAYRPGSPPVPYTTGHRARKAAPPRPPSKVGRPVISWRDVDKYLGREVVVYGIVTCHSFFSQTIDILTFFDPGVLSSRFERVPIVIHGRHGPDFQAEQWGAYEGKAIFVVGRVTSRHGALQVEANDPQSIGILCRPHVRRHANTHPF